MDKILMKIALITTLILEALIIVCGIVTLFMPGMLLFKLVIFILCICSGAAFGALTIAALLEEKGGLNDHT